MLASKARRRLSEPQASTRGLASSTKKTTAALVAVLAGVLLTATAAQDVIAAYLGPRPVVGDQNGESWQKLGGETREWSVAWPPK